METKTVEDTWAALSQELSRLGFDRLFYGYTRFRTKNGLGSKDDMLVLTTHTDKYIQDFFDREMYLNAPMTKWAAENDGIMSWSYLKNNAHTFTHAEMDVIEYNKLHGITSGYTISFSDRSKRQKGALALTPRERMSQAEVDMLWDETGAEINLLAQVAHLKISTLPFPSDRRRLSKRQREVLEWVGDGKTMQDIATIMGLTVATVEKHLRKAREALGVDTTAQAVMKASVQKQIFVTDI